MSDYNFDLTDTINYTDEQLAIFTKLKNLEQSDKIIFILYAHTQSLRKTAKILGVSYSTIRKTINGIKAKLLC